MSGKGFTRHRHDGTSPLPLGMDYSPPPSRWSGPYSVWPHDPRTGWSYCIMVDSWTMLSDAKAGDANLASPIVFYRVHVGIQSPQGVSSMRKILRRFSDFLKLHAALKRAFPKKNLPVAPPKNSMLWMKVNEAYLSERRLALADWLSKLLSDIEVSRSAPVAAFFELEVAARAAMAMVKEAQLSVPATRDPSLLSGFSSATSITSETERGSDGSGDMLGLYSSKDAAFKQGLDSDIESLDGSMIVRIENDVQAAHQTSGKGRLSGESEERLSLKDATLIFEGDGTDRARTEEARTMHGRRPSGESVGSEMSSARGSDFTFTAIYDGHSDSSQWDRFNGAVNQNLESFNADMLKGVQASLPMEQRGKVKRLLANLQQRMVMAKADMEDLTTRLTQETSVKEFLATKVRDLEGELDSTRRKSKDMLHQALSMEQDHINNLQWEAEEARAALARANEEARIQEEVRIIAEEKMKKAELEKEVANREILELKEKLECLQKEKETSESKLRSEMKVLVREIKMLRKTQPELKEELETVAKDKAKLEALIQSERTKQEKRRLDRIKFVQEVASLRKRLQECSVEFLAKQDDKSSMKHPAVRDMMEFLMTSDSRIGLLAAEAQLLAEEKEDDKAVYQSYGKEGLPNGVVSSSSTISSKVQDEELQSERAFRKMLSDIFIDNVQLYKVVNSMTLNAAVMDAKPENGGLEAVSAKRNSSMLTRFL